MSWYNIKVILYALINTFSLRYDSLRYVSLKRILATLIIFPSFIILFVVNGICLLLDEILFPGYREQPTTKLLFIVGIPRSATTHLQHTLHQDEKNFTGYKLWEYIFAPSILQKYIYSYLGKVNNILGNLTKLIFNKLDFIFFKKSNTIHKMGLNIQDEDEFLFLYNFSSIYFYFFFPEVRVLEAFVYHDKSLPRSVKEKNMDFYFRCIQRHNYVFNKDNSKFYLAKSPSFIPRMDSIYRKFPEAKFIYPIRTPFETIPSSISLIANNYSKFCRMPVEYPMANETRNMLIDWYIHAGKVMKEQIREKGLTLLYTDITTNFVFILNQIYQFIGLNAPKDHFKLRKARKHRANFKSQHNYNAHIGIDKELIRSRLMGIVPIKLLQETYN